MSAIHGMSAIWDVHYREVSLYYLNFTEQQKKFCLILYCNEVNNYIFVNGIEIWKSKAKNSEINADPLRLGNVSKDFSVDNMEKAGLYGYVYDFSVDYDNTDVYNILDIHKYLLKSKISYNVWIY